MLLAGRVVASFSAQEFLHAPVGSSCWPCFYYTWHVVGGTCAARTLCAHESCRCFQHGVFLRANPARFEDRASCSRRMPGTPRVCVAHVAVPAAAPAVWTGSLLAREEARKEDGVCGYKQQGLCSEAVGALRRGE